MKICSPTVDRGCDVCAELTLASATTMNVQAGLTPASTYFLWVIDKFKNVYHDIVVVNGDGSFDIVSANYPDQMFNENAGSFYIFLTSDIDGQNPIPMTINSVTSKCLLLNTPCCVGIGCMIIETDFIIS